MPTGGSSRVPTSSHSIHLLLGEDGSTAGSIVTGTKPQGEHAGDGPEGQGPTWGSQGTGSGETVLDGIVAVGLTG